MVIIGKIKDYYDYLAGIYGRDEKLILDRSEYTPRVLQSEGDITYFYICGWIIEVIYLNGVSYCGEGLKAISVPFEKKKHFYSWDKDYSKTHYRVKYKDSMGRVVYNIVHKDPYNYIDSAYYGRRKIDNVNEELGCPILVKNSFGKLLNRGEKFSKFPILKDYNIGSILPPEQIWQMLYDWLAKTKDIPDTQTDKEKIIGKGFDYKHSFRNTK